MGLSYDVNIRHMYVSMIFHFSLLKFVLMRHKIEYLATMYISLLLLVEILYSRS